MDDSSGGPKDTTREQLLGAAAHHFAVKPYPLVSLDDILADAGLAKSAMYSQFESKYALAQAIVELRVSRGRAVIEDLAAHKLSGLHSLIEMTYRIAVQDINDEVARAGLHLLESMGRTTALQERLLGDWVKARARIVRRAIADGDVVARTDPEDLAQVLVSLYMGLLQTTDLDIPGQLLGNLERSWLVLLPAFADPDRVEHFAELVRQRTAQAIAQTTDRGAAG
ncbi:MAG: TetR/AcrR family transcriptional regulator [Mycobacteriaceae bacterium]|nr:TetR/AcrR family transcriptional regulator [Mycobacteriaceae bacterium]